MKSCTFKLKVVLRRGALIALLLTGYTASAAADYSEDDQWFNENKYSLSTQIKASDSDSLARIMDHLGQLWNARDGALGFEVAPFISEIIAQQPDLALAWFEQHPDAFSPFAEGLQAMVFTGQQGTPEQMRQLDELRATLMASCRDFISANPDSERLPMAEALLAQLDNITVRAVD